MILYVLVLGDELAKDNRNKKGGEDLMAFTSRGGVGCCWVKPLIRLTNYSSSFSARSLLVKSTAGAITQGLITRSK
jgi:hypothetical protein